MSQLSPLPDHLYITLLSYLHHLLWNFTHHHLPQLHPDPLSSLINIGDLVLISLSGHSLPPLSSKGTGLLSAIPITSTTAKFCGLPYQIHASHLKPFIQQSQNNPPF